MASAWYTVGMPPRCSVFIAVSLDGFIARPDGRIDWLSIVERHDEDYGYKAFFDSVDALVIGRKTYETALGFENWPYATKRCVVLTREARVPSRHGEVFTSEAPDKIVASLTREGAKRIYVDGGAVIRTFLTAGLLTDLTVSVVPILLGEGTPLFGHTGPDIRLELVGSRAFESGLLQVAYNLVKPGGT